MHEARCDEPQHLQNAQRNVRQAGRIVSWRAGLDQESNALQAAKQCHAEQNRSAPQSSDNINTHPAICKRPIPGLPQSERVVR
jgi:hypothetical protein